MSKARKVVPALIAFSCLTIVFARRTPPRPEETPIVEITAKRFAFSPDKIVLKKDQTVKLRLHSEDVTHGFFLRPLGLDEEIPAGQSVDVTVTPKTAGTFTTICDHFCGANHGNMNMTIVVE